MKAWHYRTIGFVVAVLLIQAPVLADSVLLYDVDFGTPPHTVGLPPAVGDGDPPRNTVTQINFGEPLVVAALGALTNQPCAFGDHPTATYDQMEFVTQQGGAHGFPDAYPAYHVEMDVLVETLGAGDIFKIFVDCPLAHSVIFNGLNEIHASVLGAGGYDVVIGSFTPGTPLLLQVFVYIDAQFWVISVDGSPLFSGPFPSTELVHVRPSMATNVTPDPVAIDNVRITGVGSGPGVDYHCSARWMPWGGGNHNKVFVANSSGMIFGEYNQQFGAQWDPWGYRDGCGDGIGVYFGWVGGVARHDCYPPGGLPVLMFAGPHPDPAGDGVWRALAFDPTGAAGAPSLWSITFGSDLVEVDLTGVVLTVYPNLPGWSVYGLAYDPADGNLWAHEINGDVNKIDTTTGMYIGPVPQWTTGFPNFAAGGGLSTDHRFCRLAAISQGTPDELGAYDLTGTLVFGPIDVEVQSGSNGHLGVAECPAPWDLGDMNCDGAVNAFDIGPFVLCLTNPAAYALAYPCCDCINGDCNGDGLVNAFDIDCFVAILVP